MRKELYQHIVKTLQPLEAEGYPLINHFDIYNQQTLYSQQERPFALPAVLVEFLPIAWRPLPSGMREADITFNLHIVVDSTVWDYHQALDCFELHSIITKALFCNNNTDNISTINLTASTTDNQADEFRVDIDTYQCLVRDTSTKVEL